MKYIPIIVRILLGLALTVFGLNAFLNFIPQPETPFSERAAVFVSALMESGYMMELIGGTQLLAGVLLLANRFVPLALLLLAPFLVNALAFHIFLEPSGLPMAIVFVVLELYLAWVHRAAWRPLFIARKTAV